MFNDNSNTLWDTNDNDEHCNEDDHETNIFQPVCETERYVQQQPGSSLSTSGPCDAALPHAEFTAGSSGINNQRKQRIKSKNDLDV